MTDSVLKCDTKKPQLPQRKPGLGLDGQVAQKAGRIQVGERRAFPVRK